MGGGVAPLWPAVDSVVGGGSLGSAGYYYHVRRFL